MTTIYVTKFALTKGVVLKVEATKSQYDNHYYFFYKDIKKVFVGAGDYYLDEKDALDRAKVLRDNRIASLKKQIAKLEAMDFGGAK